jgi:hypothetical protein
MKISFGEMSLAGGNVVNERPYDVRIGNSRQTQAVLTMRAPAAKMIDRGNQMTVFEFKVAKKHDSVEDAQTFVLQHSASLQNLGSTLTVVEEPSQSSYSLSDAVIREVKSSSDGVVSMHAYNITGGNFSKN